jgi:phage terminase large subunit-like protein
MSGILSDDRYETLGSFLVNPHSGNIVRAAIVSTLVEVGTFYLPQQPCGAFPNGAHDDQVDAMTQALLLWHMAEEQVIYGLREIIEISPI